MPAMMRMRMQIQMRTATHITTEPPAHFYTTAKAAFGRFGFIFISVNMFVSSFGGCLSYLILIKDTIPLLFGVDIDNEPVKRAILVVSSMTISLPLAMQRDMANLSKTSVISALFDTLMIGVIVFFAPIRESVASAGGIKEVLSNSIIRGDTMFVGLGVLSFAFVCQDSAFIIAGSLDTPTKERWSKVTGLALTFCGTLSLICGISGYLAFQMETEGNVLNNFEGSDTQIAATVARALLGSTMFFVYPVASYVVRHVFVVLLFEGRSAHEGDDHRILGRRDRRMALTLFIYLLALVPAIFFDDVGLVLSFAGAIAGSCLSYIGPGSAYIAVHGEDIRVLIKGWFGGNKFSSYMANYPADESAIFDAGSSETELTPLSGTNDDALSEDDETSASQPSTSPPIVQYIPSIFGFVAWYLFLFPCWSALAEYGTKRLAQFKEEEAMKSPRINRLEPPKANRSEVGGKARLLPPRAQQAATDDDLHHFRRINSDDYQGRFSGEQEHIAPASYGATGYGNQAIAKAISRKNSAAASASVAVADKVDDKSLQESLVRDFMISILMIIGGTIAMCLGVYTTLIP